MPWFSRLRRRPKSYPDQAMQALSKPNKQQILDALPNDRARVLQCQVWAANERARWYQGQAECIADILMSTDPRYRDLHPEAREIIGRRRWSNSQLQKDIAGLEAMYSRWAGEYSASNSVRSKGPQQLMEPAPDPLHVFDRRDLW